MPELITLTEDGPLGPKGTQVWVPERPERPKKKPPKDG